MAYGLCLACGHRRALTRNRVFFIRHGSATAYKPTVCLSCYEVFEGIIESVAPPYNCSIPRSQLALDALAAS